jgi:hypothetical protein
MTDYPALVKEAADAEEVWEERRFQVYRSGRAPLIVTLSDQGPSSPNDRYMASAETDGEHGEKIISTGNAAPTVEVALSNVHWWEFG